jgi:hypothetical protein
MLGAAGRERLPDLPLVILFLAGMSNDERTTDDIN